MPCKKLQLINNSSWTFKMFCLCFNQHKTSVAWAVAYVKSIYSHNSHLQVKHHIYNFLYKRTMGLSVTNLESMVNFRNRASLGLITLGYQFVEDVLVLQSHLFRAGSLQHQQHLPVQRLIQRGGITHSGGQMVNTMGGLQEKAISSHKRAKETWNSYRQSNYYWELDCAKNTACE